MFICIVLVCSLLPDNIVLLPHWVPLPQAPFPLPLFTPLLLLLCCLFPEHLPCSTPPTPCVI